MMKILLKILVAPFVLALSLLAVFLFDIYAFLLTIAPVILAVLGIGVLSASDCRQTWCWVLCPAPFFF